MKERQVLEQYIFNEDVNRVLEKSCIPYAMYRFEKGRAIALLVSDGFCDLFRQTREEALRLLNEQIYDRDHPDDVARLGDAVIKFATEGGELDVLYRTLIGEEYRIVHIRGRHVYSSKGERFALVWYGDEGPYRDVNKGLFDQAINNMAIASGNYTGRNFDAMTGLPNMNYFFKLAEETRAKLMGEDEEPILLYFDFNDMKNYNLKYGFEEGDKLILGMSKLLVSHFSNLNCCRFGGDRFVAVSREKNIENVLNEIFEEVKGLNGGKTLSLKVGIYKNSMGYVTSGVACDRAKMACDSKKGALSSVFSYFSEDMLKATQMRNYILDNFDNALRENWIKVFYQPIIRSANGRVCDEEALARWIDPNVGFLSPGDFIPILEDTKQIYKLDLYVLEQVLKKIKTIEENNLTIVPCSVNISRSDFEMCDIVEEIKKRVDASGVGYDRLTIEITESALATDVEYIRKQAELLTELGFAVWMDDYGSGYSSPEILQRLPFNTLKLDMQFMRQFDSTSKSRIIISEIVNMALNLGLEIVVEGVETYEQVEFLREIGATKMQGYYFCKPISLEDVLSRYEKGAQIGFENPEECGYYETIGKVNLYDITLSTSDEGSDVYFNTLPMAIFETDNDDVEIIRLNRACRAFFKKGFGGKVDKDSGKFTLRDDEFRSLFIKSVIRCGQTGYQMIEDKRTGDSRIAHAVFRRLAVNPVNGKRAVAVVILQVMDEKKDFNALTYANIASALSSDYLYLYYVNLDTEDFIEYKPNADNYDIAVERRGTDFFEASRRDAFSILHRDDREGFINTFDKSIVVESIRKYGSFTYTYRMVNGEKPIYVHMKATAIGKNGKHIIIGVNNIDAQMQQKVALENIKEEVRIFSKIKALSGNYIAFYAVNPEDNTYYSFDTSSDYEALEVSKEGHEFFKNARRDAQNAIYEEDQELFIKAFHKRNVLKSLEESGIFSINYRLMMGGTPRYVRLKAVRFTENDKEQILVGVLDIDAQMKREQEYAYNLAVARNRVNLDALTGVKNKNAYDESVASIDKTIEEIKDAEFAVVVCDINNLKDTNDKYGHSAGDELIRQGCRMICRIFSHSPVFRIGGDEFVSLVKGDDYDRIDELMEMLYEQNLKNKAENKVVVAGGMSKYIGNEKVADVFGRADAAMYENKKKLKE